MARTAVCTGLSWAGEVAVARQVEVCAGAHVHVIADEGEVARVARGRLKGCVVAHLEIANAKRRGACAEVHGGVVLQHKHVQHVAARCARRTNNGSLVQVQRCVLGDDHLQGIEVGARANNGAAALCQAQVRPKHTAAHLQRRVVRAKQKRRLNKVKHSIVAHNKIDQATAVFKAINVQG